MTRARWIVRSAACLVAAGLAFVAVVGIAHTPWGRPLLRYLPGMGTQCPVGAVDPEIVATARAATLAPLRGAEKAGSRRVAGLALGSSRRLDVLEWARREGVACEDVRRDRSLRCSGVALPSGVADGTLRVHFDTADRVLDVERSARVLDVDTAVALASSLADEVEGSAGLPTSRRGEITADHLGRGALSQGSLEFRFADMRAQVIATNVGGGAFTVRDLRQSIDD